MPLKRKVCMIKYVMLLISNGEVFFNGIQQSMILVINCGACAAECPVNAISQGDTQFVIDADTCIDCGNCANVCPVGAPAEA